MKLLLKLLLVMAVLVGGGIAAYQPLASYWKERNRPNWKTEAITRGRIVSTVTSTGTVKPVLSVLVGAFVSGPIVELNVDFNDEVKEGEILARIDPRLYEAAVSRDRAALATREAEIERVQAQLQQSRNKEQRGIRLRAKNKDFISDTEMDALMFDRQALEAQLKVAKAAVQQAMASLETSEANLAYTEIKSPVDGVVIERKIDPGRTLAAQFQAPELFIIAPDLRKEVHIFASVDEAEMGLIQDAQEVGRLVTFTVDAHPDEVFEGRIEQIRLSSTETQNVVTYPVVVAAANPELRLLPGMTANISFEVGAKDDVLRVPNPALRFYPADPKHVRAEDRDILDGTRRSSSSDDEQESSGAKTATETAEAYRNRNKRHLWIVDGDFLRAVAITTGLDENKFTEVVEGDVEEGQMFVTGMVSKP